MGVLQNKITAIRELQLANPEKARMVPDLMTEGYNTLHAHTNMTPKSPPVAPTSSARILKTTCQYWSSSFAELGVDNTSGAH